MSQKLFHRLRVPVDHELRSGSFIWRDETTGAVPIDKTNGKPDLYRVEHGIGAVIFARPAEAMLRMLILPTKKLFVQSQRFITLCHWPLLVVVVD
jgi:hypothetical protein